MDKTAVLKRVCSWYGADYTPHHFLYRQRITIGYYSFGEGYITRVYKTIEDALRDWLPVMKETAENFAKKGGHVWAEEIAFIQKECCA